jgi:hypothetical protein
VLFTEFQLVAQNCSEFQNVSRNFMSQATESPTAPSAEIFSLDAARKRRYYIELARANEDWIQTCASFAIEGIYPTDDDAEHAGRLISGDATFEQLAQELRDQYHKRKDLG